MMKSSVTRRILTLLVVLCAISLFVSGQVFAWTISRDFEGGTTGNVATGSSGFFWVNSGNMKFSTAQAHSGSKSVSAYFQSGSADTTGATFEGNNATVSEGGEVWFREYLYFPAGFNFSTAPVQKIFRISTTSGYLSVYNINGKIAMSNEPSVFAGYDEPGTQAASNVAFSTGQWQCIEMYVKLNHTVDQGIFRIWKDGVLVLENKHYPTLPNASAQVNDVFTQFNYWNGGSPANQTAYVDDLVITNVTPSARDAAGNAMIGPTDWGGASQPPPPTSPPPTDTTPPVISGGLPSGTLAYGTTTTNLAVTTNENATCKFGTTDASYSSMPNTFTTTGGTSHSQSLSGLANGGSYTIYVRCIDASNNANTTSSTISFNVSNIAANLLLSESFESSAFATSNGWYDSPTQGTIVSGGQSGNCLQWTWAQGKTLPNNVGGMTRRKITPTDKMYVSFYVKFQQGWQGSQMLYHPHVLSVLSNLDGDWAAPSDSYLNTYIEFISDIGSPYAIRPQLKLQDTLRTNKTYGVNGTPLNSSGTPVNISALTENRSVNTCNGYKSGSDSGTGHDCYDEGGGVWYSATNWKASSASVTTNTWHQIETYFQMNSISGGIGQPDGIMQMWVDGTPVIDKSNIIYRTGYGTDATKKWAQFDLQGYIGSPGSPITQTMWLDELKVYDGLPSNLSKPAAPTGLKPTGISP